MVPRPEIRHARWAESTNIHQRKAICDDTTITNPNLDKIHNLYAAYGRGDVAGALADLADDVD